MTSLRTIFFIILSVQKLRYLGADNLKRLSPVKFSYKNDGVLKVDIILKNVPSDVIDYSIYHDIEEFDQETNKAWDKINTLCSHKNPSKHEKITADEPIIIKIMVKLKGDRESLKLYIQLRNKYDLCVTEKIMEGVRNPEENIGDTEFSEKCLHKFRNSCQIHVDFGHNHRERYSKIPAPLCEYFRDGGGGLYCKSPYMSSELIDYQWSQIYKDDWSIGAIPPAKGKQSVFTMRFLPFDHNTIITLKSTGNLSTYKISLPPLVYNQRKYERKNTKTYSEKESVYFWCQNKAHTQIGWIDPTGYHITTYDSSAHNFTVTKKHNGSIFCCINYIYYDDHDIIKIDRTVEDFTLLLYEKKQIQDKLKDQTQGVVKCDIDKMNRVTCITPPSGQIHKNTVHYWFQAYIEDDNFLVGRIPSAQGLQTNLTMTLQQFDQNTKIYCIMNHGKKDNVTKIEMANYTTISLGNVQYEKYIVDRDIKYTELVPVDFECSNRATSQIGLIDPTGYKIRMYDKTSHLKSLNFTERDNNSILCCIHYKVYENYDTANIERFVEGFTRLVYDKAIKPGHENTSSKPNQETPKDPQDNPKIPQGTSQDQSGDTEQLSVSSVNTKY